MPYPGCLASSSSWAVAALIAEESWPTHREKTSASAASSILLLTSDTDTQRAEAPDPCVCRVCAHALPRCRRVRCRQEREGRVQKSLV